MMNLTTLRKKLSFKVVFHIVIFTIISLSLVFLLSVIDTNRTKYESEKNIIIKGYEKQIITKDNQNVLESQVDSLNDRQNQITVNYNEEIKNISDASADDHCIWMESVLSKLDHLKK
jgi:hypothetical protein